MSETDKPKGKEQKGQRDNLRTSMQQKGYTQMINKEQSIVIGRTRNDLARLEPLFGVNNKLLGMFKKDDYNNSQIKIGHSLLEVDLSKVDPTKTKPPNRVRSIEPASVAFRAARLCQ